MPRRTAQQVLNDIAAMHDLVNPRTGKLNYSAFAKRTGIPHPTLIRIMQGEPEHVLSSDTVQKLINSFQLSFAQVRGDVPIRRSDRKKYAPSDADIELLRRLRSLPLSRQNDIVKLIELNERLTDSK